MSLYAVLISLLLLHPSTSPISSLLLQVRHHFISFLHMIAGGNGRRAAHHMLHMGGHSNMAGAAAFTDDMEALFADCCNIHGPDGIDVDKVGYSYLFRVLE